MAELDNESQLRLRPWPPTKPTAIKSHLSPALLPLITGISTRGYYAKMSNFGSLKNAFMMEDEDAFKRCPRW